VKTNAGKPPRKSRLDVPGGLNNDDRSA